MATYTTAGPSYLPSYYQPYMREEQGYYARPVAPPSPPQWPQPIPRRWKHAIPIIQPTPIYSAVQEVANCQKLEEQAAEEIARKEAAQELVRQKAARRRAREEAAWAARFPELPSLRALREALPETSAPRPSPTPRQADTGESTIPNTPPRQVFRPPPALFHIDEERRNRVAPLPAVPAPEVGWTVRLVPSKPFDTVEEDLPRIPIPPRFRAAPSPKSAGKRRALPIPPYAGSPATDQKVPAPRGPRPCIAHRRAFSDNVAAFEPLRPVHERRHTFSDMPPPVPPKDEVEVVYDEPEEAENVPPEASGGFLEAPKLVHPPTPPLKDLEKTLFVCVFCSDKNVGTLAHQEHIRRHVRV